MASTKVSLREYSLWYKAPKNDVHRLAMPWVQATRKDLNSYYSDVLYYMELYAGSRDLTGAGTYTPRGSNTNKLKFNLTASVVDTALSIVGSARTLPQCQSRGGDWTTQRKAKLRTAALQSQFQDLGLFGLATQAIGDGCVGRLGALHFFVDPETSTPGVERVLPLELSFDPVEANSGDVRTIARSKLINRDVAIALYPEHKEKLLYAKGASQANSIDFTFQRDSKSDQILVVEIWRLPSSAKSKDGRHAVFTDNVTLVDEKWTRPRFPLAFYRWAPMQVGFLGKSLVAECEPAQRRVEQIINYTETCQNLGSRPMVWLEKGSQIEPEQVDNLPMSVGRYVGTPPIFSKFDATPDDMENTIDRIRERILTQLGLSASQISGERPAGVTSAVGLKTVEDIASRRHVLNIRQVEIFYLQCAQLLADTNDELADSEGDFKIDRRVRSRFLESTSWKEVQLEDGDMKLTVYPISSLPPTPAGQLDQIQDWINTGYVDQAAGMMLLGMPDTQAFESEVAADRLYAEWQIEKLLEGKRVIPDQYSNIELATDLVRRQYLNAKSDGAPEPVLNQFRFFLSSAKNTLMKVQATTAPQQPTAPAPAPGLDPLAAQALPPGAGPLM